MKNLDFQHLSDVRCILFDCAADDVLKEIDAKENTFKKIKSLNTKRLYYCHYFIILLKIKNSQNMINFFRL